jgi:hypothetical protein
MLAISSCGKRLLKCGSQQSAYVAGLRALCSALASAVFEVFSLIDGFSARCPGVLGCRSRSTISLLNPAVQLQFAAL